jgi:hypothetical protein
MANTSFFHRKAIVLLMTFVLSIPSLSTVAFSQELVIKGDGQEVVLTAEQLTQAAEEIDREAEKEPRGSKIKKSLKKVSSGFKKIVKDLKKDPSKKKKKLSLKRILLGAGKGSTFVSVNLLRPFVNVAGFLTGFFEKAGKNQDSKAFLNFFLNHEKELDDAWKNTGNIENFAASLQERIEDILLEKQIIIITDLVEHYTKVRPTKESVLKTLGLSHTNDQSVKTIPEIAFEALGPELMFFKLDASLINEHPEFQELRPLIGDVEGDSIESIMNINPEFDLMDLGNRSRIKLHEGLIAFSGKIFVPKIVLGIVSKAVAGVVTTVGLVADAGMITSSLMCTMNKKVKAQIENGDEDMVDFCSYVVNKSAYTISKSRARGYVKGKNFKRKFIKGTAKAEVKLRSIKLKKEKNEEIELK